MINKNIVAEFAGLRFAILEYLRELSPEWVPSYEVEKFARSKGYMSSTGKRTACHLAQNLFRHIRKRLVTHTGSRNGKRYSVKIVQFRYYK